MMPTIRDKCLAMRRLHDSGCFVIPNPWDVGSARYLQGLGFKALATTSSGMAWSQGAPDNRVDLETALAHIRSIAEASELPVNADFESGFAEDHDSLARNVARCLDAGVAALSLEDSSGDKTSTLYPVEEAVARLRTARAAADRHGSGALLVGRAECYLVGHPDAFSESLRRLKAYAAAGADVLYAPAVSKPDEIAALVQAVAPKPLNVLAMASMNLSVPDLAALGVRRISVGGALARCAWGGFIEAARELAQGSFQSFAAAAPSSELNRFFSEDQAGRQR
jgi:2-methylisocitrate lyase-like PEP mutase family enzyme